jgi:5'-nucleotidase
MLLFAFSSIASHSGDEATVAVQILAINDFHGSLEPPSGSVGKINGIDAGGAEYLATHLKEMRKDHEHTITVSAGDLFGASPLLSAMFHEEPTIEAMNLMGLDLNAVGNHEFDNGWHELLRVAHGDGLASANFSFLAANVVVNATGKTLFPAYQIRQFGPVKIAFVGVVVQAVDLLVTADDIEGLTFLPEADAVNALIPELEQQGVRTVVVMIHEGGYPTGDFNECPGISGPIVEIARRMHDNVAVVLSGHTHRAYNCQIGNKLVTSAASNGRLVTDVTLIVDGAHKTMRSARADNVIVTRIVAKDSEQSALIKRYKDIASPIANRVIGHVSEDISKLENNAGESLLGRLLADAQLEATMASASGAADIAFTNPGGIRTDLSFQSSRAGEGDGNITFGEAYAVQPFGNRLIMMSLTGDQIIQVLEQQFAGCGFDQTRILQISKSLRYSYRKSAYACHKIDRDSITIDQVKLVPDRSYRVVANNFIAEGGDGFSAFKLGTARTIGMIDLDALTNYLSARSVIAGDHVSRITALE